MYKNYENLVNDSSEWEIQYEFGELDSHTSLRMVGTQYPNSLTEPEFNYLKNVIIENNLQKGFEVATGAGISTLAIGLGFKETNGKLVTMDAYNEEFLQDPLSDNSDKKFYDSKGYKSVKQLIEKFNLEENVKAKVGWSPSDTETCINSVFSPEEKLDFIFIDAFHTDEAAIKDFDSIKNRINPEKFVVALHDVDGLPETVKYVEDFFGIKSELVSERPWGFYLCVIKKLENHV